MYLIYILIGTLRYSTANIECKHYFELVISIIAMKLQK